MTTNTWRPLDNLGKMNLFLFERKAPFFNLLMSSFVCRITQHGKLRWKEHMN
jgi:hypothetical protein